MKYQIILLGASPYHSKLIDSIHANTNELGIQTGFIEIINEDSFAGNFRANAPTYAIYFGDPQDKSRSSEVVQTLLDNGNAVLPVVSDLSVFKKLVPPELHHINGFELSNENRIAQLASVILEGLGLFRLTRKLFISYKRDESSTVAIQLYEQLEKCGFDVFLDTHSVRPGDDFQEELWHRMADTDIVILLNTSGFLKSQWTVAELAKANAMSIGVSQLVWPDHKLERNAEISVPLLLEDSSFEKGIPSQPNSRLTDKTIEKVVSEVESLRARSLAARRNNIITEFVAAANNTSKPVQLHPQHFFTTQKSNNDEIMIIPTVGVPQALNYYESDEIINKIKSKRMKEAFILYDHRNIRDKWLRHLDWLDTHLHIKTLKITDAQKWLKAI